MTKKNGKNRRHHMKQTIRRRVKRACTRKIVTGRRLLTVLADPSIWSDSILEGSGPIDGSGSSTEPQESSVLWHHQQDRNESYCQVLVRGGGTSDGLGATSDNHTLVTPMEENNSRKAIDTKTVVEIGIRNDWVTRRIATDRSSSSTAPQESSVPWHHQQDGKENRGQAWIREGIAYDNHTLADPVEKNDPRIPPKLRDAAQAIGNGSVVEYLDMCKDLMTGRITAVVFLAGVTELFSGHPKITRAISEILG